MNFGWKHIIVPILWTIFLLINVNQFFFWDTIQLASKHAHWFYEQNFNSFFLPQEMDSGHFPFFGMLLAFCWKIFGVKLWVGHALMIIINLATIFQVNYLGKQILGKEFSYLLVLLFFLNPAILGQALSQ